MADAKISDFADGTTPAGSDLFPVERSGGTNKSLTWTEILTAVKAVTLDLFAVPAANVAMNAKKLTGLAAGTTTGDSIRYEQVFAAGAVPIADLADPTTGKVIGSASSAAAAVYPPGYEIGYDQITSGVTVASTTEASGTTIITCASHTFDGAAVMVEFFTPNIVPPLSGNSGFLIANLFESTTDNGRIMQVQTNTTVTDNWPVTGRFRFTPSAGAHSFVVTAWKLNGSGTVKVDAGAGGTGTMMPCFVRFTKV